MIKLSQYFAGFFKSYTEELLLDPKYIVSVEDFGDYRTIYINPYERRVMGYDVAETIQQIQDILNGI